MVPKTPTEFTSYKFSGVSAKYNFPKFSLVENNLNDRYVLVEKTIREYSLFKIIVVLITFFNNKFYKVI